MASAVTTSLVLVILSLTVSVNSQTCSGTSQYGECSSNNGCRCLPLSFTDDVGICALIGVSCSRLSPCQSPNDDCQQAGYVCVRHPQCHSQPLCYPLSMIDQRLCPPAVTIETPTSTTGFPWMSTTSTERPMTTTGQLWSTSGFPWTFTTTRASTDVTSTYSSALTIASERYSRNGNSFYSNSTGANFTDGNFLYSNSTNGNFTDGNYTRNHYYEAIQVRVNTTGYYTFRSSSQMDAYGYLYQSQFDPFNPSLNLVGQDDDSAGNRQFTFSTLLHAGAPYTLVFTTFGERETGNFSVIATGPYAVDLTSINSIQTTTAAATTVTSATLSGLILSNYSNILSTMDDIYPGANKFYQTIEIVVNTTGVYDIVSLSQMDTYGYLYQGNYFPSNPSLGLIEQNDDSGGNAQFKLTSILYAGVTYTLVFTTFGQNQTGPFSVLATGPATVSFTPSNTQQTTMMTSTQSTVYSSEYAGALTLNSSTYYRNENASSSFYFAAIEVIVSKTGNYTLTSNSTMDTYGYIYQRYFYQSYPTVNIIAEDDDTGGGGQFQLATYLRANIKYILVVTTYGGGVVGSFRIEASGPDLLEFISK